MSRFLQLAAPVVGSLGLVLLVAVSADHMARAGGTTFTVNSTAGTDDSDCTPEPGGCTLPDAIKEANTAGGNDTITFDAAVFPAGAPATIMVQTALPAVKDGVTIDGTGAGVIIDGAGGDPLTTGLLIHSGTHDLSGVTVRNVTVRSFPGHGISVCGGDLPGCGRDVTGLDFDGVVSSDNGGDGIRIAGQSIRDVTLRKCTLAGNGAYGLLVESDLDSSDLQVGDCTSTGNNDMGIFVTSQQKIVDFSLTDSSVSQNHTIGAYLDSVDETISPVIDTVEAVDNGRMGIGFSAAQPLSDLVFKNSKVDSNGSTNGNGLGTEVLAFQIIGATVTGNSFSNNVASNPVGGVGFQVYSQFERPSALTITGNTVKGNVGRGIAIITDAPGNSPVEVSAISGNEVSGNSWDGVTIYDSGPVTISDNRIYGNTGIGIDLRGGEPEEAEDSVTPNDPGDTDKGSNDLLNFPVLTGVTGDMVEGTACGNCSVELFASDGDPTGYGEGKTFIGSVDAAANGGFSMTVCGVSAGGSVTATATDSHGNTSEFSANYPLPSGAPPCAGQRLQGDVDCNGDITSVDALKELRFVAQLSVSQNQPCPGIGTEMASSWGDVDCNGEVTSVDALKILRHVASLPVSQNDPCPDIGTVES